MTLLVISICLVYLCGSSENRSNKLAPGSQQDCFSGGCSWIVYMTTSCPTEFHRVKEMYSVLLSCMCAGRMVSGSMFVRQLKTDSVEEKLPRVSDQNFDTKYYRVLNILPMPTFNLYESSTGYPEQRPMDFHWDVCAELSPWPALV